MSKNNDTEKEVTAYEIYLSAEGGQLDVDDDGLVWKEVLREGEWKYRPGPGQTPVEKPLRVTAGHAGPGEIGFADLQESFGKAIDHVTVPTSHADKPHENTGYVRKLETREVDGINRLYAGIEFTEPDIKEKALRGTIANTSVGVIYDYIKKSTGEKFRQALGHVALTNKPWINDMAPFGVNASEEVEVDEDSITPVVIEPDPEVLEGLKIENVADFDLAKEYIIGRAKELGAVDQLPSEWQDKPAESAENSTSDNEENKETNMSKENNSSEENQKGENAEVTPAETGLSEEQIDAKITEATSSFETKLSEKDAEVAELKRQLHEKSVAEKISALKGEGFSEFPGLLKEIENLYLSDQGEEVTTISLSEEGKDEPTEVKLSVTGIVDRIIESLPKEDGKLNFGEQVNEFQNFGERESKSNPDYDPAELADEINKRLGRPVPSGGNE